MTIRERLNRNKRRQFVLFVASLVAFLVGISFSPWSRTLALCMSLGSLAVAILVMTYGQVSGAFNCPRCWGSLAVLMQINANPFSIDRRIRYCPFCGFDLDAKEGATPTPKTTDLLV